MKNCPVCQTTSLTPTNLEAHLSASECSQCEGQWLTSEDYQTWLDTHTESLPPKSLPGHPLEVQDNRKAAFCPQCEQIMLKAKVGYDLDFLLDRCPSCQSIWLDKNEWANLKRQNLHDKVHRMFGAPWQAKVRQQRLKKVVEQAFSSRLSPNDYSEAQRIKEWLEEHPQKQDLLSFLFAT